MQDCEIHGAACGAENFPEHELRAAAEEHSPELDGKILQHAIDIVWHRHRLPSAVQLARSLGYSRSSFYRYARGERCVRRTSFNALIQQLADFDAEGRN
jgi:hypothetical protein